MLNVVTLVVGMMRTNCYITYDAGTREAAVIDPGDRAGRILELIRGENLTVRNIFLTHGHFDHIMALEELRRATGAKTVVHGADADLLRGAALNSPFKNITVTPSEPDILVSHGETFPLGGYVLEVLHTPGHTPGSICLRVPTPDGETDGVLFSGDTLFEDDCGRCDLPGGDYQAMLSSLRLLAALDGDYTVYPGHDAATVLSRERVHNVNMREAIEG